MITIADVEDAILQARNQFNKISKEATTNYMRPYNELSKAMALKMMDPKLKEELAKKAPAAMADLEKRFTGKEK